MVTNQFEALLSAEQKHAYDIAIERCDLKRLSYYQRMPEQLMNMSGFGVAAKVISSDASRDIVYIEDDPFVIPSDLNGEHLLVDGKIKVYERNVIESPYAQERMFGFHETKDMYRIFASAGNGIIVEDSKNEKALIAAYRLNESSCYSSHWNPTIGAARYSEMAEGLGEHLGLLSTSLRRTFTDVAIVDPYGCVVVPQEYYKTCAEATKEEYFEQALRKITAMAEENKYMSIRKPKSIVNKPSELLRTPGIKKVIVTYRGKEYQRSGIVDMGQNVLDYNIMGIMLLKLHMRLRDFSYYHLQENAKTGLALNRILALFCLNCNYRPERNPDGSIKMSTAYQYGYEKHVDDIPDSRMPTSALKEIMKALGSYTIPQKQEKNQQKTKAPC